MNVTNTHGGITMSLQTKNHNQQGSSFIDCASSQPNQSFFTLKRKWNGLFGFVLLISLIGTSQSASAQCSPDVIAPSLICNTSIDVFLGGDGQAPIHPADVIVNATDNCGIASMTVSPSLVTCSDLGPFGIPGLLNVTATVTDVGGNAVSCLVPAFIMDNIAPAITCPADITIDCTVNPAITIVTGEPVVDDNCDPSPIVFSFDDVAATDCNTLMRTWFTGDVSGNSNTCVQIIAIEDNSDPILSFTPPTPPADVTINCQDALPIPPSSSGSDDCDASVNVSMTDVSTQGGDPTLIDFYNYTVTRTWTATDNCGNTDTHVQIITVQDITDPAFSGVVANINEPANASCMATISLDVSGNVSDNCVVDPTDLVTTYSIKNTGTGVIVDSGNGLDASGNYNVGNYEVTFTATDPRGNTGSVTVTVNVTDNVAPTASCKFIIEISVPPTGTATITPAMIDNGSSDNCTPLDELIFSVNPNMVTCADILIPLPPVVLTVTDASGNSATCNSVVNVVDNSPAAIFCKDITRSLDGTGNRMVGAMELDDGTTDACGLGPFDVSKDGGTSYLPSVNFDCSETGDNSVILRVTDSNGNEAFCNATVTIIDNTPPSASPNTLSVVLDTDGSYTLDNTDLANLTAGSTDNCSYTASANPNIFDCSDIDVNNDGINEGVTSIITLTDPSGNTATFNTTITVNDNDKPMITAGDLTVGLDANGQIKVNAEELINGVIYLEGSDNGSNTAGSTNIKITVSNAINLSFDWFYATSDDPEYDPFGYAINGGTFIPLTNDFGPPFQFGLANINLDAGDELCLRVASMDNTGGNAFVFLENFSKNFTGDFAMANWTITTTNSDGTAFINDPCGPILYELSTDGGTTWLACETFDCSDIGAPIITSVRATDRNGNVSLPNTVFLTIEDNEAPVAACEEQTVALNGLGIGTINAVDFDNGSVDACGGVLSFMISNDGGSNFSSSIDLGCTDVGGPHEIIFQAIDQFGNDGLCVTQVTVQENLTPVITCPVDVTIDCSDSTDPVNTGFATANDNCDGPVTPTYTDVFQDDIGGYNDDNCRVIKRTWRAEDSGGNVSICIQYITIEDNDKPSFFGLPVNTAAECTPPAVPGVSGFDNCDLSVSVSFNETSTQGVNPAACSYYDYTITRTWIATDNCGNSTTATRTVAMDDTQAPTFAHATSMMVANDAGACTAAVSLDLESAIADCATFANLTVSNDALANYGNGDGMADASGVYTLGTHIIEWTATDPCGNSSNFTFTLEVLDTETPIAVCHPGPIPVVLNSSGIGSITPSSVDNGSSDNCGIMSMAVNPSTFDCTDIGNQTVTLTITDVDNNTNSCNSIVNVIDGSVPSISCPVGITINCGDSIDPTNTGQATAMSSCAIAAPPTYSDMVVAGTQPDCYTIDRTWTAGTATCVQTITIEDNIDPVLSGIPTDVTVDCDNIPSVGSPTATDNCATPGITFSETDTQGGDPTLCSYYDYTITRTWTASDNCMNTDVESQTITVEDNDVPDLSIPNPLVINNDANACEANINVDLSIYVYDCAAFANLTMTNTALADYGEGNGTDNLNGVYPVGDYPITVTATDPCGNTSSQTFTLTILDNQAPQAACHDDVTLVLDSNGNGSLTTAEIDNGSTDNCGITMMSISPNTFTSADVGQVTVTLTLEDAEGNTSNCQTTVTVVERVIISTAHVTGTANGTAQIPISVENFENICGLQFSIHVNNAAAATVTGVGGFGLPGMNAGDFSITGNDIAFSWLDPAGSGVTVANGAKIFHIEVQLAGTTGLSSTVTIDGSPLSIIVGRCEGINIVSVPTTINDGSVTIGTPLTFNLDGTIQTEVGDAVELVQVAMTGSQAGNQTTGAGGSYSFSVNSGSNETITPSKNINHDNGVNVVDVLLLQQHILNSSLLTSPYKIIAADVNDDGAVNVLDRIELQFLVLGNITAFLSNTSWRFVDGAYVFPTPTDPFTPAFPEDISYANVTANHLNGDFIGVKIGDLNCDADPMNLIVPDQEGASINNDIQNDLNNRSAKQFFAIDNTNITSGNEYRIDFKAKDFQNLVAYQFALNFDESFLNFKNIEIGNLPSLSQESFGLGHVEDGIITTMWYQIEAENLADETVLFSLVFDATQNAEHLSDLFTINHSILDAIAVTADFSEKNIDLDFNETTDVNDLAENRFQLFQNRPNPFNEETTVAFYLPNATKATITITDLSGKVIKTYAGHFESGLQEVVIRKEDLSTNGIYLLRLETATNAAQQKLILIGK